VEGWWRPVLELGKSAQPLVRGGFRDFVPAYKRQSGQLSLSHSKGEANS